MLWILVAATHVGLSAAQHTVTYGSRGAAVIDGLKLTRDDFSLTIDGRAIVGTKLPVPTMTQDSTGRRFRYTAGEFRIEVLYESRPAFLRKSMRITAPAGRRFRVDDVTPLAAELGEPVREIYVRRSGTSRLQTGDYGAFLRFDNSRGLLAAAQNPFLQVTRDGQSLSITYKPEMDWNAAWGAFECDAAVLATYRLTGRVQSARMRPEWTVAPQDYRPGMDAAEVEAFTNCVRGSLVDRSPRPANVFVGWCVNDFQIDIAKPEGREEYKRIIDRAVALGADHVLFAPANTALALRAQSTDDWSWENLLWLGLGQKIRRGEWKIASDPVPSTVQEMIDYAGSRELKLLAYVYPVLGFLAEQHPEWLVPGQKRPRANLGVRSYQDWLIDALVTFVKRTGISGYSFDHTFLWYPGTSRYAQWHGWRRVMEELRRQVPDVIIDGRQAYHMYGPWSWLAGTYPHPTYADEQPESFVPFPDLHFDRVSANRQRWTAWRYRNYDFAPAELMPGFITHQTPRIDESGKLPVKLVKDERTGLVEQVALSFRARDWDYLGWRYSLLSSIATAGLNNVLNMIPARDLEENRHFSQADQAWFRKWIDWTAQNKAYLQRTRTILDEPGIGAVDGTSAVLNNKGWLFLFNPNARRLPAHIRFDTSIGMTSGPISVVTVREHYPLEGRRLGTWRYGEVLTLMLDGTSATVLEIIPGQPPAPALSNATGDARIVDGVLDLTNVMGAAGTEADLHVKLPSGVKLTGLRLNGQPATLISTTGTETIVTIPVRFSGAPFARSQQVGEYDPAFTGGVFKACFTIPERVFRQLRERKRLWPIPWTAEDLRCTWLAPERLLLFVQIAEPSHTMNVLLKINSEPVRLEKAYSSVRTHARSFVGFYADVSSLSPDREYSVELELPTLKPGQFQGVFFDNVEPEYTSALTR